MAKKDARSRYRPAVLAAMILAVACAAPSDSDGTPINGGTETDRTGAGEGRTHDTTTGTLQPERPDDAVRHKPGSVSDLEELINRTEIQGPRVQDPVGDGSSSVPREPVAPAVAPTKAQP